MRTSACALTCRLKSAGFNVRKFSEPKEHEDGFVEISERIHVQVGLYHVEVVELESPNAYIFHGESRNFQELTEKLKELMS